MPSKNNRLISRRSAPPKTDLIRPSKNFPIQKEYKTNVNLWPKAVPLQHSSSHVFPFAFGFHHFSPRIQTNNIYIYIYTDTYMKKLQEDSLTLVVYFQYLFNSLSYGVHPFLRDPAFVCGSGPKDSKKANCLGMKRFFWKTMGTSPRNAIKMNSCQICVSASPSDKPYSGGIR